MILSDKDFSKRVRNKSLVIKPFKRDCVQPSTYDVHLSNEFRLFTSHETAVIDLKSKDSITELIKVSKKKGLVLHPGEFVLGSTTEYFEIPDDLAGKLEGKSSLGRLGLVIHATAGYIDPGFKGYVTFEMSNLNRVPIVLYPGMRVGQICFIMMSSKVDRPYGTAGNKYQGQKGPTESRIWKDFRQKNTG